MTLNVGWFTTANGPGSLGMFRAAVDAISNRTLDANIQFVFVNRTRGQSPATDRFFDQADANHIPVVALSSRDFRRAHGDAPWQDLRHRFDAAALERLSDYAPDIGMQAGYMLYAPLLCERFLMLNQHPALPGGTIGRWQDAVQDVIRQRAQESGAMVHIATADLDRGPVATYCRFPLRGGNWDALWAAHESRHATPDDARSDDAPSALGDPLFRAIRAAGILRERPLVVRTLAAIADGAIPLPDLREHRIANPLDLTQQVEADVAAHAPADDSQAS